ncbi:hypothetical protein HK096_007475 [Nowakowskiella sp. JEL0078]|nr:hypothetical protein HK096_007475 [Nowakowskiella sp. JEL0078]
MAFWYVARCAREYWKKTEDAEIEMEERRRLNVDAQNQNTVENTKIPNTSQFVEYEINKENKTEIEIIKGKKVDKKVDAVNNRIQPKFNQTSSVDQYANQRIENKPGLNQNSSVSQHMYQRIESQPDVGFNNQNSNYGFQTPIYVPQRMNPSPEPRVEYPQSDWKDNDDKSNVRNSYQNSQNISSIAASGSTTNSSIPKQSDVYAHVIDSNLPQINSATFTPQLSNQVRPSRPQPSSTPYTDNQQTIPTHDYQIQQQQQLPNLVTDYSKIYEIPSLNQESTTQDYPKMYESSTFNDYAQNFGQNNVHPTYQHPFDYSEVYGQTTFPHALAVSEPYAQNPASDTESYQTTTGGTSDYSHIYGTRLASTTGATIDYSRIYAIHAPQIVSTSTNNPYAPQTTVADTDYSQFYNATAPSPSISYSHVYAIPEAPKKTNNESNFANVGKSKEIIVKEYVLENTFIEPDATPSMVPEKKAYIVENSVIKPTGHSKCRRIISKFIITALKYPIINKFFGMWPVKKSKCFSSIHREELWKVEEVQKSLKSLDDNDTNIMKKYCEKSIARVRYNKARVSNCEKSILKELTRNSEPLSPEQHNFIHQVLSSNSRIHQKLQLIESKQAAEESQYYRDLEAIQNTMNPKLAAALNHRSHHCHEPQTEGRGFYRPAFKSHDRSHNSRSHPNPSQRASVWDRELRLHLKTKSFEQLNDQVFNETLAAEPSCKPLQQSTSFHKSSSFAILQDTPAENTNAHVKRHIRLAPDTVASDLKKSMADICIDLEFPVSFYSRPKEISSLRDELSSASNNNVTVKVDNPIKNLTPKHKFCYILDDLDGSHRKRSISARERDAAMKEETASMNVMRGVTETLQDWVRNVLEAPSSLFPKPEMTTSNTSLVSSFNADESNPEHCSDLNASQNKDFDVLLNACKPNLMDSKPPMRLNVLDEANPPEALINSLRDNLGVIIQKTRIGTAEARARGIPEIDLANARDKGKKSAYGRWYVQPSKWEKIPELKLESNEQNPVFSKMAIASQRGKRQKGIVQQKLEEIVTHRAKEDQRLAQMMAQMFQPAQFPQLAIKSVTGNVDVINGLSQSSANIGKDILQFQTNERRKSIISL